MTSVWVYPSEILPLGLRQKGSAISTACNWITKRVLPFILHAFILRFALLTVSYFIVQITPISINNIGWKTYIIFAVINAAFLPPIYFFYPETKVSTACAQPEQ